MNLVTRVDHEKTVTLITLQSRFFAKLKNIILIFGQLSLWSKHSFCCLCKRVDSENNHNNFKTLKLSIETIIKNTEMLRFVPHHLKTKKICKNAGKKLLLVI